MKKTILFSYRQEVGESYFHDLKQIFEDKLDLSLYTIDHLPSVEEYHERPADIALVSNPEQIQHARYLLHNNTRIINIEFSYSLKSIDMLKTWPNGTRAKISTCFPSVRKNLIRLFYDQGVNNIIWVEDEDELFDLLVTDDLSPTNDHDSSQLARLYQRKISFNTLLQIAISADILDSEIENRLFEYAEGYRSTLSIFPFLYSDLASSNLQIQAIFDGINDAIAILDYSFRIIHCNSKFASLFPEVKNMHDISLPDFPSTSFLTPFLLSGKKIKNQLVTAGRHGSFVLNIERIDTGFKQSVRYCLIIQPLYEIENREKSLRQQIAQKGYSAKYSFSDIKSVSEEMNACLSKARIIAGIDKTTLIVGESGVGKELLVQAIHSESKRKNFPFVSINCAAIPASLLESELFGYNEGAFTGSKRGGKKGLFEMAHCGTLFLDEIGETSLDVQSKLLRAIETKEIMRVGGDTITHVDVRIIAATNRNLKEMVKQNKFRLDLYYRLNTIILRIPPLRQRKKDILMLADHFIYQEMGENRAITPELADFLTNYHWEGNVRELRNVVEYMVNITSGPLGIAHLPDYILDNLNSHTVSAEKPRSNPPFSGSFWENYNPAEIRILKRILELVNCGHGNRNVLLGKLSDEGMSCSTYRLRKYLEDLRNGGFLTYGKGPKGIELSERGKELLENF